VDENEEVLHICRITHSAKLGIGIKVDDAGTIIPESGISK
jgi:hypothetical protein